MGGLILIGFGGANILPVPVSLADKQKEVPSSIAIAAVTTTGYAGVLLGPALLGAIAHHSSLPAAFDILAAIMAIVPILAFVAIRRKA